MVEVRLVILLTVSLPLLEPDAYFLVVNLKNPHLDASFQLHVDLVSVLDILNRLLFERDLKFFVTYSRGGVKHVLDIFYELLFDQFGLVGREEFCVILGCFDEWLNVF